MPVRALWAVEAPPEFFITPHNTSLVVMTASHNNLIAVMTVFFFCEKFFFWSVRLAPRSYYQSTMHGQPDGDVQEPEALVI